MTAPAAGLAARLGANFATQRAFVADASHELRTPLTAIGGLTDVLVHVQDTRPDEARRLADLVRREVDRMAILVDELLVLARVDAQGAGALQLETVDVRSIARDVCEQSWWQWQPCAYHESSLRSCACLEVTAVHGHPLLHAQNAAAGTVRGSDCLAAAIGDFESYLGILEVDLHPCRCATGIFQRVVSAAPMPTAASSGIAALHQETESGRGRQPVGCARRALHADRRRPVGRPLCGPAKPPAAVAPRIGVTTCTMSQRKPHR